MSVLQLYAFFMTYNVKYFDLIGEASLKVGISTTYYELNLTNGQRCGLGVYTGNLLSSLKKINNVDVHRYYYPPTISSCFGSHDTASATQLYMPYLVSGCLSHGLNLTDINNRLIKSQVDIFHCTDYKIPKLKGVPVIATLHDAVPLKNPEWTTSQLRRLKNAVLKNSARWVDHVITISNFVVEDIVEYWGIPEENISVVHNGVDNYWFQMQSEEKIDAVKLKFYIDKPYILFVGTFQPRKNIDRIIDAYISLPDHYTKENMLVLVGREGWGCESLQEKVDKLVSSGKCVRIKNATDREIRCLYQDAEVFLFPSLHEGFGLPVLEAFACGAPVITSRCSALEEVAGDAALLVDPYLTEDIADKLKYLLDIDKECREKIINYAIERAKQFSWDNMASRLYDIYKRFC